MRKSEKYTQLGRVFTPSTPITSVDFFVERLSQVSKVRDTILTAGEHAVLYGERGVGKTSLANFIQATFDSNVPTVKITCNSSDKLNNIWNKVFKAIAKRMVRKTSDTPYCAPSFCVDNNEEFDIDEVVEELERLECPVLIIIDEFDNVDDPTVKQKMADIVKVLSDNIQFVTLMMVGVAENINELVENHNSNSRCLRQIKLDRMKESELKKIIENGLARLGFEISLMVEQDIVNFSQGFPHYVHMLTKNAAAHLIEIDDPSRTKITKADLKIAIDEAINSSQEEVRRKYEKAVTTARNQDGFRNVLWACALLQDNENGVFRAIDIADHLEKIIGKPPSQQFYSYNLPALCNEGKGAPLKKVHISGGDRQVRYQFSDPMFKAFVRMKIKQELGM
jgi:Cdc6-like AAA superfamily ATPase